MPAFSFFLVFFRSIQTASRIAGADRLSPRHSPRAACSCRPEQLRTLATLWSTACYLVRDVFARACAEDGGAARERSGPDRGGVSTMAKAYVFVEDRLRAVRQDLAVQGLGGTAEGVGVLETTANFYVLAGYLMSDQVMRRGEALGVWRGDEAFGLARAAARAVCWGRRWSVRLPRGSEMRRRASGSPSSAWLPKSWNALGSYLKHHALGCCFPVFYLAAEGCIRRTPPRTGARGGVDFTGGGIPEGGIAHRAPPATLRTIRTNGSANRVTHAMKLA